MPTLKAKINGNWVSLISPGMPAGGALGDILTKSTAANYATAWASAIPKLSLTSTTPADLSSTLHPLTTGLVGGNNIAIGSQRIQARNNGAASNLDLNPLGGAVNVGGQTTITPPSGTTDLALILNTGYSSGNEGAQMRFGGAPGKASFDIDNYAGDLRVLMAGAPGGVGLAVSAAGAVTLNGGATVANGTLTAGNITMSGLLNSTNGGEGLRMALSGYQSWYNGGTRTGYLQGNNGQIYLNVENGSLRLRGASGCYLDNGTNNYQVSESVIGTRIVACGSSGYIYGNYFNMTADESGDAPRLAGSNGSDNFIRWYRTLNANKITWNNSVNGSLHTLGCYAGPDGPTFLAESDQYDGGPKSWSTAQYRAQSWSGRVGGVAGISFWIQQANAAPMFDAFTATGELLRCVNNPNTGHVPIQASQFAVISARRIKERIEEVAVDSLLDRIATVPIHRFRLIIPPQRLRLRPDYEPRFVEDEETGERTELPAPAEAYESHDHDCALDPCVGTHTEDDPCPEMANGRMKYGFMAEDLGAAFPELAPQDETRQPGAIDIGQVAMVAFAGVAALWKRVQALEAK